MHAGSAPDKPQEPSTQPPVAASLERKGSFPPGRRRSSGTDDPTLKPMSVSQLLEFLEREDFRPRSITPRAASTTPTMTGAAAATTATAQARSTTPTDDAAAAAAATTTAKTTTKTTTTAASAGASGGGVGRDAGLANFARAPTASSYGVPSGASGTSGGGTVTNDHGSSRTASAAPSDRRGSSSVGPKSRSSGGGSKPSAARRSVSPNGGPAPRPSTLHEPSYQAFIIRQKTAAEKRRLKQSPNWATGSKWRKEGTVVQPFSFDRPVDQVGAL